VDKVTPEQAFLRGLKYCPVIIVPQLTHTHTYIYILIRHRSNDILAIGSVIK